MGHNKRDHCVQFVKAKNEQRNWKDVKIIAFDVPQATDKPYSQRLELLKQNIHDHPIVSVIKPVECTGRDHLEKYFSEVCIDRVDRGEGIIVRDPKAWYFKDDSFFKKVLFEEAMVMKLESGQVKWPSGKISALQLPALKNSFYVVRYPSGQPENARFVSTVISKEDVYQDFFHYFVAKPSPLQRCTHCHKQVDTKQLYIQTCCICILEKCCWCDN